MIKYRGIKPADVAVGPGLNPEAHKIFRSIFHSLFLFTSIFLNNLSKSATGVKLFSLPLLPEICAQIMPRIFVYQLICQVDAGAQIWFLPLPKTVPHLPY